MELLTAELKRAIVNQPFGNKKSIDIPNDHPIVQPHIERLEAIAEAIGVDFSSTYATFRAAQMKNGTYEVYMPALSNDTFGVPHLYWGHSKTPLSALPKGLTFDLIDKTFYVNVSLDEKGEDVVVLPVMVIKEGRPTIQDFRKAYNNGDLGKYLSKTIARGRSMGSLTPGEYVVTGYDYDSKFDKYVIYIQGEGGYSANSAVARKLADRPVITSDQPSELEIGESTEQYEGRPIVPAKLKTAEDQAVPVYTW